MFSDRWLSILFSNWWWWPFWRFCCCCCCWCSRFSLARRFWNQILTYRKKVFQRKRKKKIKFFDKFFSFVDKKMTIKKMMDGCYVNIVCVCVTWSWIPSSNNTEEIWYDFFFWLKTKINYSHLLTLTIMMMMMIMMKLMIVCELFFFPFL